MPDDVLIRDRGGCANLATALLLAAVLAAAVTVGAIAGTIHAAIHHSADPTGASS